MNEHNTALRKRSGSVDSSDPLVDFIYHLIRDHVPAGAIEEVMQKHVFPECREGDTVSLFCNGYLADYAKDVAARLQGPKPTTGEVIPVTDYCPVSLMGLRGEINNYGRQVHFIVVNPEFFREFPQSMDAAFDRETKRQFLELGVMGYWHTIPVLQNQGLSADWRLL